ncbi:hypothetical protein EG328_011095 [Venturia inaequalis]|uniref:Uncharacterized protein n=1 Tax=Venturia inaequalis TaxID=5025 RepID=A0A8H3V6Q4_VENIN|nr:hypothetical protein EG328_011095 [Venturia inaequalis]
MEVDSHSHSQAPADSELVRGFWKLPSELRNAVYEELLVTDCAFRLGHHGPYSHEPRREIFPNILRTCSAIHFEAIAILYGNNSFFLGPVGFKPTYSASFLTSIGPHNALLIRTVVAHSINPSFLTEYHVKNWFTSLGLDFPTLKIIAVSFGPPAEKPVPSIPPAFHIPPLPVAVLGSHWPQATISGPGFTPAGGASPIGRIEIDKEEALETEYDTAAKKTKGWMEKRKRNEVENLVSLRNTDLRAGDDWLVYVSPAVKKRMARRMW